MTAGLILTIALLVALVAVFVARMRERRSLAREPSDRDLAFLFYEHVADEVGGLVCVENQHGWPQLRGLVDGLQMEIDQANDIGAGLEAMLGLRCTLPEARLAPNAALWVGDVDSLRGQYGDPRPCGDPDDLFEVYTRVDPGASDWWQEPGLLSVLKGLPGGGILLFEGQLTVIFSDLDADSVRAAAGIPGLIRRGVARVTVH